MNSQEEIDLNNNNHNHNQITPSDSIHRSSLESTLLTRGLISNQKNQDNRSSLTVTTITPVSRLPLARSRLPPPSLSSSSKR
jgi:hypothetical protein